MDSTRFLVSAILLVFFANVATSEDDVCSVSSDTDTWKTVCNDTKEIPVRFALWPLAQDHGPREIMAGYTSAFKSDYVLPLPGPTGKNESAYLFGYDNTNSYLQVSSDSRFTTWREKSYSITFYVKNVDSSTTAQLIEFTDGSNRQLSLWFEKDGGTTLKAEVKCKGDSTMSLSIDGCSLDTWHYIALTIEQAGGSGNSKATIYCDSLKETKDVCTNEDVASSYNQINVAKSASKSDYLRGPMSCLTFHNSSLSKEDIDKEKILCDFHFSNNCSCNPNSAATLLGNFMPVVVTEFYAFVVAMVILAKSSS